jgi:hypothetical protein
MSENLLRGVAAELNGAPATAARTERRFMDVPGRYQ